MAKKGEARERITLACTVCKEQNYRTEKNKKRMKYEKQRIELIQYGQNSKNQR